MPTLSPNLGLSGQESGEALQTPEQSYAQAAQEGNLSGRLSTAGKVGLLMAALAAPAITGCDDDNPNPVPDPTPVPTEVPTPPSNPFEYKNVCEKLGLLDAEGRPRMENYRRMFIQMDVNGKALLYEPCAPSAVAGEAGQFVAGDCKNTATHRVCTVPGSYVDSRWNTVNTTTEVKWLLNGYNATESAETVDRVFSPFSVSARFGQNLVLVPGGSPVVFGQQKESGYVPAPTPQPPKPKTVRSSSDCCDQVAKNTRKNDEQDARLDNLEAEAARNRGVDARQDREIEAIKARQRAAFSAYAGGNPHPTTVDIDGAANRAATK